MPPTGWLETPLPPQDVVGGSARSQISPGQDSMDAAFALHLVCCEARLVVGEVGTVQCRLPQGHTGPCLIPMTEARVLMETMVTAIERARWVEGR